LPEPNPYRRPAQNHFIVGLVILGLGVILLLDRVGLLDAERIFLFWPLILIWFGYHKFVHAQSLSSRFWGGFLLLLGASFQAEELGFSHVRFDTIWPVLLICAGILLILKRYEARGHWQQRPPDTPPPAGPPIDVGSGTPQPPGPPAAVSPEAAEGPAPSPPPFSTSGPAPGASATTPSTATGGGTAPFQVGDPSRVRSNFAGEPAGRRWPDSEKNRDEFRQHMHDFGQRMDEFGERMYENWRGGGNNYSQTGAPHLNEVNIFWGGKKKIIAKNFSGGEVVAIFGGYEIDLTEAGMQGDQIVIDVVNIFGGGEIRVPGNWEVVMETVGIFGGCTDRTYHPEHPAPGATNPNGTPAVQPKKIIIKGVAIFGGLGIKN
jgi:cell wall-active antibiotic response 4TMS protein YvqF